MRALLIGLAASLTMTAPAQASSRDSVSISIPYRDLDLTTAEGMKTFRQRSKKAIHSACASLTLRSPLASAEELSCRTDALAQAMQQVEEKRQTRLAMLTSPTG
jgi:UrcA family protein